MTEDAISRALMTLNEDYLSLYYSKEYQDVLRRRETRLQKLIRALKWALYIVSTHDAQRIKGLAHRTTLRMTRGKDVPLPPVNRNLLDIRIEAPSGPERRTLVYTCIFGGYELLKEPLYASPSCDYVVVTDAEIPENSAWKHLPADAIAGLDSLSPRMKARYIKTHPHVLFPEYRDSVFVDASVLIVADVMPLFDQIGSAVLGVHTHPDRKDLYEEGKLVIAVGTNEAAIVHKQMNKYWAEGCLEPVLYETKILVRRHMEAACIQLMENWWAEIAAHSERDQISLPYVIWKAGAQEAVCVLGENPNRNPRFRCFPHMRGELQ